MNYDIVFIGQMGVGTIVPFEGPPFVEQCSPVVFSAIAASCTGKRIAAVTRVPDGGDHLLKPLRSAGVAVFAKPGEAAEYRVVFPTADVDRRQPFMVKGGDDLAIGDLPPFSPCLVHLCCIGGRESQIELMRVLKGRGFRLSIDMQGFVLQPDPDTGVLRPGDVPEKEEILAMADFVKVDAIEAEALTGRVAAEEQARRLEEMGSREVVITSSEGALACGAGKTTFARFNNRTTAGRMGRGDTVAGSYLASRLDHSIEESLRFAAALTSIKLESSGPFRGSPDDVMARMKMSFPTETPCIPGARR